MSAPPEKREAAPLLKDTAPFAKNIAHSTISKKRLQVLVSVFANGYGKEPIRETTIADIVRDTISGGDHAELVGKIRAATDKASIKSLKMQLPAVSLSGRIEGKREEAMAEGRLVHSGWLQIDLDAKDIAPRSPEEIRELLATDPHILAAWLSPSGTGAKALMAIPVCHSDEGHKAAFLAAENYFRASHNLQIDASTKDSNRLCFMSADADLKVAASSPMELDIAAHSPKPEPKPRPKPSSKPSAPHEGLTAEDVREMLACIPPRPPYDEWLKIASAVWGALGEPEGTAALCEWSPEERPGEYERKHAKRLQNVTAGTLVHMAKANGWKRCKETAKASPPRTKSPPQEPEAAPHGTDAEPSQDAPPKDTAKPPRTLDSFRVSHADTLGMSWKEIDALRPPFVIDHFIRQGELMLLGAESKSRKSWLAQDAALCVASGVPWLADEDGKNGFSTARASVHFVDLELNPSEMRFRFAKARGNRFADDPTGAAEVTERVHSYSLDGMNVADILPLIEELKARVHTGDLVIVDCLYRLVPDGSEVTPLAGMLETLKRFVGETQCAMILVDHFRKAGDEKARNRFAGSFVKQASASTLVAIEVSAEDLLVMSIDARTFHGLATVYARFNLGSYAFNRVPEEEIAAAKEGKRQAENHTWIVQVWKSRTLDYPASYRDAAEKWGMQRQGATLRFNKLQASQLVDRIEPKRGQAVTFRLTASGKEVVAKALNLHPRCTHEKSPIPTRKTRGATR